MLIRLLLAACVSAGGRDRGRPKPDDQPTKEELRQPFYERVEKLYPARVKQFGKVVAKGQLAMEARAILPKELRVAVETVKREMSRARKPATAKPLKKP